MFTTFTTWRQHWRTQTRVGSPGGNAFATRRKCCQCCCYVATGGATHEEIAKQQMKNRLGEKWTKRESHFLSIRGRSRSVQFMLWVEKCCTKVKRSGSILVKALFVMLVYKVKAEHKWYIVIVSKNKETEGISIVHGRDALKTYPRQEIHGLKICLIEETPFFHVKCRTWTDSNFSKAHIWTSWHMELISNAFCEIIEWYSTISGRRGWSVMNNCAGFPGDVQI